MITLDLSKCSGCSRCEVHCSFFHSGKIGRSGARIKVVKIEDIGIDYPVVCQQCRERYCTQCPEKAIEDRTPGAGDRFSDPVHGLRHLRDYVSDRRH